MAQGGVGRLWARGYSTIGHGGVVNPLERRVVVTGLGLVTPLGVGVGHVWARLLDGACGVRKLVPEDLGENGESLLKQLPSTVRVSMCPSADASRDLPSAICSCMFLPLCSRRVDVWPRLR
eukprot:1922689-Pyramimonas_sp.AAC.1